MRFIFIAIITSLYFFPQEASSISKDTHEYNENGVKAMNNGDFRAAIDFFQRALASAPENEIVKRNLSNAYNNYGVVLSNKGDLSNAVDNFEKSARYNPKNAYALMDLGHAYYKQNKLDKAVYYLKEAKKINPGMKGLKELLEKASGEEIIESGLHKTDSTHFTIVSEQKINPDNLANVKISLEQAYSRVGAFLNFFTNHKTTVILYSENDYASLIKGKPEWAHATFDGKIRIPMAGKIYTKEYLSKIIYHEFAHALVREITGGKCPMWLNEGIAVYVEGFVEKRDRKFFEGFINKNTFVSFSMLPQAYSAINNLWQANLYYREFYLLTSFIVDKYGSTALRNMLKKFAAGKSVREVFYEEMSIKAENFDDIWRGYVFSKLGL